MFNKKNKLFLLLLLCTATIKSTVDNNFIQTWKSSYVDRMSSSEKQLFAIIMHLLHANAIVEHKIRQFSTPIARLNQSIRTNIDQYKSITEDATMLRTLIDRLSFVVSTRTIYNEMLNRCLEYYNNNRSPLIDAALGDLQLYAQITLRSWINEKDSETASHLKKSSENIQNTLQHFQGVSHLHKTMSEGNLPIEISREDEENKSLIILSILLEKNPETLTATDFVINSLNEISDYAAQIIPRSIQIYKELYTVIYEELASCEVDRHYASMLFNTPNNIPNEHRILLPEPHHTFEYMLQTVKAHIQTEYSQP